MTPHQSIEILSKYRCCILIPTYNNAKTIKNIVYQCKKYCNDIWVINDGSTDETGEILKTISNIKILTQNKNEGKGVAIRRSFKEALIEGFENIITIDSDGQHDPQDIAIFAEALNNQANTLYIGSRNMDQDVIPGKSKFGHKNSNFWFWVETGIEAKDTQSGFRLYPLEPIRNIIFFTWRYEFEIEVIVRLAWKGVPLNFIPIKVYYPENRVSHFRPIPDFTRVAILNIFLVILALIWYRPILFIKSISINRLNKIWKEHFVETNLSTWNKSISAGLGIAIGILPIWGFQTITALVVSIIFKLHKPITILTSNISITPMIPIIMYISMGIGSLVLNGHWWQIDFKYFNRSNIQDEISTYVLGAIIFAFLSGIITSVLFKILIDLNSKK
jgi:glycosyltransferase involved in cell wall biosynthesis